MIKECIKWVGIDGLLHFLVCYAMMLTFGPYIGNGLAIGVTLLFAFGKEAYDVFIAKDNNFSQAMHDLSCDFAGIVAALLVA